jgi:hypothetical protein
MLLSFFNNFYKAPALCFAHRAGFHDLHNITDSGSIVFVMSMKTRRLFKELAVDRVFDLTLYIDGDGFHHLVAAHNPDTGFPAFSFGSHNRHLNFLKSYFPFALFGFQSRQLAALFPNHERILDGVDRMAELGPLQAHLFFRNTRNEGFGIQRPVVVCLDIFPACHCYLTLLLPGVSSALRHLTFTNFINWSPYFPPKPYAPA